MTDEAIVNLYWDRLEQAIVETKQKYEKYLLTISSNVLSDWEDCMENVNDTYMSAWNSMPPHRPQVLSTYLGKINRQGAIDIYRKKTSQKRKGTEYDCCIDEMEEILADGHDVEQTIDARMLSESLNQFIKGMPKAKRAVFIGRYFYMDSMKRIAEYTGMSEQNVKNILHRTRKELREYLIKEGYSV